MGGRGRRPKCSGNGLGPAWGSWVCRPDLTFPWGRASLGRLEETADQQGPPSEQISPGDRRPPTPTPHPHSPAPGALRLGGSQLCCPERAGLVGRPELGAGGSRPDGTLCGGGRAEVGASQLWTLQGTWLW